MASHIPLNDLIEGLAGAIIEAQDRIEQHQILNLLRYFDEHNRPKSITVRLPSIHPQATEGSEDLYRAALLPLVSTNLLKIKDVELTFDVDLGELSEEPAEAQETKEGEQQPAQPEIARKTISVDMSSGRKGGSIHVVLHVEGSEPTDGAARLVNHLAQTQGVFKTLPIE